MIGKSKDEKHLNYVSAKQRKENKESSMLLRYIPITHTILNEYKSNLSKIQFLFNK